MTGLTSLWVLYFQEDLKFWTSCLDYLTLRRRVNGPGWRYGLLRTGHAKGWPLGWPCRARMAYTMGVLALAASGHRQGIILRRAPTDRAPSRNRPGDCEQVAGLTKGKAMVGVCFVGLELQVWLKKGSD